MSVSKGLDGATAAWRRLLLWKDMALLALVESVHGFVRDDGFQKAGMLAYYTFMALLPLLLALLLLGGRFLSPHAAVTMVETMVGQLLPQSKDLLLREVTGLAEQKAWSLLSIVVLFWWMAPVASVLRVTFANIFKAKPRVFRVQASRPVVYVLGKLYDMAALLLIVTLMGVLVGTGWVYDLAERLVGDHVPVLRTLMRFGIPKLTAFACLYVFYWLFVPHRRNLWAILAGAGAAALLLKFMNPLFALLLQFNPDYGYMFGSLKAVFIFFIWIFYASLAILFGAEVMSSLARWRDLSLRDHLAKLLNGGEDKPRYRHLARRGVRACEGGERLFEQGDAGEEMYVVVRGRVALIRDGERVAMAERGQCFGEVGALLGKPRLAAAVVEPGGGEVVAFSPAGLSDPELLLKLLQDMAGRLVGVGNGGGAKAAPPELS